MSRRRPPVATLLLPLALATACGSPLAIARRPAGTPLAANADPRSFDRAAVVARSAEILAQAARDDDAPTLGRFDRWARGADPDPAATRAMARQALDLLEQGRAKVQPGARELLAGIATGRVTPGPAAQPLPIAFPRDEGAHLDAITEWWYLNGHLADGGKRFGFEFTMFRVGPVLFWAHVALTDESRHAFRYVREWYLPGRTRSHEETLDVAYGSQRIYAAQAGRYHLAGVAGPGAGFDLDLASRKRPLLVGGDGNIDMPEGRDSRYYSLTRLESAGTVRLGERRYRVSGLSWLDHQWGPFYVSGFRERWDWFSVQADDGTDYNLFAFRGADGTPLARHVNRLDAAGTYQGGQGFDLASGGRWRSPRSGASYATRWEIGLAASGERLELTATEPDQELSRLLPFPLDPLPEYWEGSMRVVKSLPDGRRVGGFAYAETFAQP